MCWDMLWRLSDEEIGAIIDVHIAQSGLSAWPVEMASDGNRQEEKLRLQASRAKSLAGMLCAIKTRLTATEKSNVPKDTH